MRLREAGELGFLRLVRGEIAHRGGPVLVGVGDDAAVLVGAEGEALLLKCDAAVEGRHFRREWFEPEEIGARAARCAISDIAAMGGRPVAVLLTLFVSPNEELETARDIVRGVAEAAERLGAELAGGETVGVDGPLALDIIVAGFVAVGRELRRSGARPGDALMVSGTLGGSAAGLACLEASETASPAARWVIARYKVPEARVALGQWLVAIGAAHAAIDISDGLIRDAGHLAAESGVGITIEEALLPVSAECREVGETLGADPLAWALSGGEDFELLFTIAAGPAAGLETRGREELSLPLTRIGTVVEGEGVRVLRADGSEYRPAAGGWDQFTPR